MAIYNLKIAHVFDGFGNRSTMANYMESEDGSHRCTKLNGHLHEQIVKNSITCFRQAIARDKTQCQ